MNRYIVRAGLPLVLISFILLTGCKKLFPPHPSISLSGGGNKCPAPLKLTATDTIPAVGSDVTISTNQAGPLYQWAGPANFFETAGSDQGSILISGIKLYQTGWYYCSGSQVNCNSVFDSVYINVQYQQGTPSCALTNDQISNTAGIPDFTGGYIYKDIYSGYGSVLLDVDDGGGTDYNFLFNPSNGSAEPKDGVYYTTDYSFGASDLDADAISLTINYFPYFLNSHAGQKVYVSHVNGKLRISFCSMTCSGDGVSGTFTGQVTEP